MSLVDQGRSAKRNHEAPYLTGRAIALGWVAIWVAIWVVIFARADNYDYADFCVVVLAPLLFVYLITLISRKIRKNSKLRKLE